MKYTNAIGEMVDGAQIVSSGSQVGIPLASGQVLGSTGGSVGAVDVVGGTGVQVTQTGTQLIVTNTASTSGSGGSAGSVGWSPYQEQDATLTNDVVITTAYTGLSPTLAQMQTVLTASITPSFQNSSIQIEVISCAGVTGLNPIGVQFAVFTSQNTTTALHIPQRESGDITGSASGNFIRERLIASVPSQNTISAQVPITVYFAASLSTHATALGAPNPTIYSNNASNPFGGKNYTRIRMYEVVSNSDAVVWETVLNIPTSSPVGSPYPPSAGSNGSVVYTNSSLVKQRSNSVIQVRESIQVQSSSTASCYCYFRTYLLTTALDAAGYYWGYGSYIAGLQGSIPAGTSSVSGRYSTVTGEDQSTEVIGALFPYILSSGPFSLVLVGWYQGSTYTMLSSPYSSLIVAEVCQGVNNGYINEGAFTPIQANITATAPAYPWTSNIVQGTGTPVGTFTLIARATGSTIDFNGEVYIGASAGNAQSGVLFAFWDGSTLVDLVPCTQPSGGSAYNEGTESWDAKFASPGANANASIFVEAWRIDSTTASVPITVLCSFSEFLFGYVTGAGGGAVSSLNAAGGSFLTVAPTTGDCVVNTTLATASTAGLVSASSIPTTALQVLGENLGVPAAVNLVPGGNITLNQTGNNITLGSQVATVGTQNGIVSVSAVPTLNTAVIYNTSTSTPVASTARGVNFSANVFVNFGGAHVGQALTASGITKYNDIGVRITTALTGAVQDIYDTSTYISVSVTTKGTSTGAATIIGLSVIPYITLAAYPAYYAVDPVVGVQFTNSAKEIYAQVNSGSTTIQLVFLDKSGPNWVYIPVTAADLSAAFVLRVRLNPLYTTTAPP